jgi:hypothetical protein
MSIRTDRMAARLSSAFSATPGSNLYTILDLVAFELDAFDTAANATPWYNLSTASGQSLNNIVAGYGLTRLTGESDMMLVARLNATLLQKRSCGTVADILACVISITGVPASNITLTETAAVFSLQFYGQIPNDLSLDVLVDYINRAKALGVKFLDTQMEFHRTIPNWVPTMSGSTYWYRGGTPAGWGGNWCKEAWGGLCSGLKPSFLQQLLLCMKSGNGWGFRWGRSPWGDLFASLVFDSEITDQVYLMSDLQGWGRQYGKRWGDLVAGIKVAFDPFSTSAYSLTTPSVPMPSTDLLSAFCTLPLYNTRLGYGMGYGATPWNGKFAGIKFDPYAITLLDYLKGDHYGWGRQYGKRWADLVGSLVFNTTEFTNNDCLKYDYQGWGQYYGNMTRNLVGGMTVAFDPFTSSSYSWHMSTAPLFLTTLESAFCTLPVQNSRLGYGYGYGATAWGGKAAGFKFDPYAITVLDFAKEDHYGWGNGWGGYWDSENAALSFAPCECAAIP